MGKRNKYFGLSSEELYRLPKEDKIAYAYSYVTNMSTDDAQAEIAGENLDDVREYVQRCLYDKKVAVESFIKLLESIDE